MDTTHGDLGEQDVSKPKVSDVVEDRAGHVEKVVVSKGVIFKKKLEVPADRIEEVDTESEDKAPDGKVIIETGQGEVAGLKAVGEEELAAEDQDGLLDTVEQEIPTEQGLRELEASGAAAEARRRNPEIRKQEAATQVTRDDDQKPSLPRKTNFFLKVLGPGFLAGMSGNDPSAVTAYAVDGASAGYGHLWLLLLSTFMYQSVQYTCAKIGRVTRMGFSELLKKHYSPWVAYLATILLLITNIALIAADLVALGSGLELITHISWIWFIVPMAIFLWYIVVFSNFETIKKVFIVMSLAFVTYIVTTLFSHADWAAVLSNTFIPRVNFNFTDISAAVALLGATISPYSMFWQVQGEKEEARAGSARQQLRGAGLDVAIGVIGGNLVSYFIIICTAATLFAHHQSINTAEDAARALQPLLGPFATYLFAIGLIGAGLIAIPVLLASTSYAITGAFGWPAGLSRKPWQSEGFYLILTVALVISIIIAFLRFNPIQLIFWANILAGILAPALVVYLLVVSNNRKIMGDRRIGWVTNIGLAITILVLVIGVILLFYGLASGQG